MTDTLYPIATAHLFAIEGHRLGTKPLRDAGWKQSIQERLKTRFYDKTGHGARGTQKIDDVFGQRREFAPSYPRVEDYA